MSEAKKRAQRLKRIREDKRLLETAICALWSHAFDPEGRKLVNESFAAVYRLERLARKAP